MSSEDTTKKSKDNFGVYTGRVFLELKMEKREWLVESLIREKDTIILVGEEKSGKSLLVFQLICSVTSQHPFLDKYAVAKPCRVTYIQLEGEFEDSQDRFKRMIRVLDFNKDLFQIIYSPPLGLQELEAVKVLENKVREFNPDIIFIDPLYFTFRGSLSDDNIVRRFLGNIRVLKNNLDCAVVLVHHTHKIRFNMHGEAIGEGDEAIFGSKFFKAYPDHLLFLGYDKKREVRTLSCTTQRGGDIIKKCSLRLIEPDPLYFEETEKNPTREVTLLNILMQHEEGLSVEQIMEKTDMKRNIFYQSVKKPLTEGLIVKTTTRPVVYSYRKEAEHIS